MTPKLIIEQKITAFVNKYSIYQADAEGEKTALLAMAQQKRLAFKEKVRFYNDEAKTSEIFGFEAEKVLDVHGRYFVTDTSGNHIGGFRKIFKQSLLISSWHILDTNGEPVLLVKESNVAVAILRRFIGFVPIIGGILELLMVLFKYHFELIDLNTNVVVGRYQKTTLFRDHYTLSLTDAASKQIDWRTYAATAVALDALQSR